MANISNFNDTWEGHTHGEVEDVIKSKVTEMETETGKKYEKPDGGIPLEDLSDSVQDAIEDAASQGGIQQESDPTVPSHVKNITQEQIASWNNKVDPDGNKVLSDNNYTTEEKAKLAGIEAGAQVNVAPDAEMSGTSENAVQNKVIKAYVDQAVQTVQNALNALMSGQSVTDAIDTFNEIVTFLNGIDTDDPTLFNQLKSLSDAITALNTAIALKANSADLAEVATSGSYNDLTDKPTIPTVPTMDSTPTAGNTTHMVSSDGVAAAIAAAIAQAGGQVTVTTNGDGTFTIHAADDYTINLNHTHENMAKLVVCEESDLPSTLDPATIYGVNEDGEIAMLYVGGIPFYGGGGGGASTPVLRQPTDGSSFEMGGASRTIKVKGKNLTQALTIELTGTGYAFGNTQPSGVTIVSTTELTVSAAAANAVSGVDVVVEYSGSNPYASGTIGITSGSPDNISCEASLLYNDLVSANYIKFTGQQYLLTDYHPNPKTHLEMDMKFEDNGNFNKTTGIYRAWFGCNNNTVGAFRANFGYDVAQFGNHECMYWMEKEYVSQTWVGVYPNNFYTRSTWTYNNNVVSFLGVNTPTETKTTTQDGNFEVGADGNLTSVFNAANILMYSIKIYEDDVLVREYLPKKSTSGNVYGMFETKTKQFITSGSSTGFEGA